MYQKFGLDKNIFARILSEALSKGGDFADLFFQYSISSSINMEEDIIKNTSESISLGLGIRVIDGDQTGYAFSNDMSLEKLLETARTASVIARSGKDFPAVNLNEKQVTHKLYDLNQPLVSTEVPVQIELVKRGYYAAKNYDSKIVKVSAGLSSNLSYITIANSEGLLVSDVRPQIRLMVSATANDGTSKTTAMSNSGGRYGLNFFESIEQPENIGRKAAEEAIVLLTAISAPSGEMPVVLGSEESGVMIHEAMGHPLEADSIHNKTSVLWNKFGEVVANPNVTIYDNAAIPFYRGSLNIDDEGMETQDLLLVDKGKLVGFMNDYLSARQLGHKRNGHGRRQSYQSIPIPRMNNTVLAPGEHTPEEILSSVDKGIYAKTFQGGMVNGTGKFTFSVNLGYMIENGKLTQPIKNVTLIGTNLEILKRIDMVGNDMGFFLGTCGKQGQSVSVTAGTPTLKISQMTVGGSNG
jgi:TldD protein